VIQYLGKQTLGAALPTALAATVSAETTMSAQLPGLSAQLAASISVQPPAVITDLIQNLLNLIAALEQLAASGAVVIPPAVNASASLEFDAKAAGLQASIALQASLIAMFGVAGFYAYYFTGACSAAGAELSGEVGAGLPDVGEPSQQIAGLYLLCSEGPAIEALKGLAGI
jgi:hypothetical protein